MFSKNFRGAYLYRTLAISPPWGRLTHAAQASLELGG